MNPTDRKTLERYASILESLTKTEPATPAGGHRRRIHVALEDYCRGMAPQGDSFPPGPPFRAAEGEIVAAAALRAAGVVRASGESAGDAGRWLEGLIAAQRPSGEFLIASASDNPEPHWYHELVILHSVAAYAVHTGRAEAWAAVERAASFHLNETQPDHATTEPWALPAFLRSFETLPLADQLLHAVQTQHPDRLDRVSWMLLRDAVYSLRKL